MNDDAIATLTSRVGVARVGAGRVGFIVTDPVSQTPGGGGDSSFTGYRSDVMPTSIFTQELPP